MLGEPVVQIDALSVSLDDRDVIRSLDLQVSYGERLCIVGPAGSGKSLLLELIAGRAVPHRGHLSCPAWAGFNSEAAIGVAPRFADSWCLATSSGAWCHTTRHFIRSAGT